MRSSERRMDGKSPDYRPKTAGVRAQASEHRPPGLRAQGLRPRGRRRPGHTRLATSVEIRELLAEVLDFGGVVGGDVRVVGWSVA